LKKATACPIPPVFTCDVAHDIDAGQALRGSETADNFAVFFDPDSAGLFPSVHTALLFDKSLNAGIAEKELLVHSTFPFAVS
jgi:hypothetical protein